jgi:uncharacterized protein
MIFVDTGFLLALAQPTDGLHRIAMAWAKVVSEPLVVTEYVIWEVFNSLSAPPDRPKAHLILASLTVPSSRYEIVCASAEVFQAGIQLHRDRPDKDWSLTDCISFQVMRQRSISRALAYDLHFVQRVLKR